MFDIFDRTKNLSKDEGSKFTENSLLYKGGIKKRRMFMKREELLAPPSYNLVSEIEKYTGDKEKLALIWQDDKGNRREVTYAELMKGANKIGNAFIKSGLQKGDKLLIMMPRLIEAYMTYIAAIKAGFVVIPSSEMLRKRISNTALDMGK